MRVKPSAFAAPFHYLFTRPVVEVDGKEYEGRWGTREIPMSRGAHRIRVYFRYRGRRAARLGEAGVEVSVEVTDRRIGLTAKLGPTNGSTFRITAQPRSA
ncbi:hypothetical protein B1H18_26585 [Streptomyces tsukubensis]|uniref:DUF2135 domain-containing protein n=1 Tax=Streptomyces tsukubensis TaxID=83656 RepID=A0A1V4A2R2_9ACTN|nr:hypothetical protein B1H18_26585 [Streptomyces tsukubensis]